MEFIKINPPEYVKEIVETLNNYNYKAYLVGGCVRDAILGRKCNDWDIATNALPDEIQLIFLKNNFKVITTGLKHGTLTVGRKNCNSNEFCEVTTFRVDGEYKDNRHPEEVIFVDDIYKDLSRRDFTINAIAYDLENGVFIDPFNGLSDINNKIIRAVNDANLRFSEDALRMLRALRFSFVLNFCIEEKTFNAIKENAKLLDNVAWERKNTEFIKILNSNKQNLLQILKESTVLNILIPEFKDCYNFEQHNPAHIYDVFEHINMALNGLFIKFPEADIKTRLAVVFHDIGKPETFFVDEKGIGHFYGHGECSERITKNILRRMKFDNKTIKDVCLLVKLHDYPIHKIKLSARKLIQKVDFDEELLKSLIQIKEADNYGQNPDSPVIIASLESLNEFKKILKEVWELGDTPSLKTLEINGNDLLEIGWKGSEIKEELEKLLRTTTKSPVLNNRKFLINSSKSRFNEKNKN